MQPMSAAASGRMLIVDEYEVLFNKSCKRARRDISIVGNFRKKHVKIDGTFPLNSLTPAALKINSRKKFLKAVRLLKTK